MKEFGTLEELLAVARVACPLESCRAPSHVFCDDEKMGMHAARVKLAAGVE